MIFSSLLIISGIIIDNTIEGYRKSKEDCLNGDYPVFINPKRFSILKFLRLFFYLSGIIFVTIFSKDSAIWIFFLVFFSILYNSSKVCIQKYPPFDSLMHFYGGIVFTIFGGIWEGGEFLNVVPIGISLGLIFTGGYLNHLLMDRERDEKMGKLTLAHILSSEKMRVFSLTLIISGDILMGYLISSTLILFAFLFLFIALVIFYSGLKIKDPKQFRIIYRLLHLVLGFFIAFFILIN